MTRLEVRFAARADANLRELPRRRAGQLRRAVGRASANTQAPTLFLVRTRMDVAACQRLDDEGGLLVYDVRPAHELARMLYGPEIDNAVTGRAMRRLLHSRRY